MEPNAILVLFLIEWRVREEGAMLGALAIGIFELEEICGGWARCHPGSCSNVVLVSNNVRTGYSTLVIITRNMSHTYIDFLSNVQLHCTVITTVASV